MKEMRTTQLNKVENLADKKTKLKKFNFKLIFTFSFIHNSVIKFSKHFMMFSH
jgi:hypothetical protein